MQDIQKLQFETDKFVNKSNTGENDNYNAFIELKKSFVRKRNKLNRLNAGTKFLAKPKLAVDNLKEGLTQNEAIERMQTMITNLQKNQ